jgi:hypothetical protein
MLISVEEGLDKEHPSWEKTIGILIRVQTTRFRVLAGDKMISMKLDKSNPTLFSLPAADHVMSSIWRPADFRARHQSRSTNPSFVESSRLSSQSPRSPQIRIEVYEWFIVHPSLGRIVTSAKVVPAGKIRR